MGSYSGGLFGEVSCIGVISAAGEISIAGVRVGVVRNDIVGLGLGEREGARGDKCPVCLCMFVRRPLLSLNPTISSSGSPSSLSVASWYGSYAA